MSTPPADPPSARKGRVSHGSGEFTPAQLRTCGRGVVFEPGVLVFHPENVSIGEDVYIGHRAILKGYHLNELIIGDGCWIGQNVFIHSAGGVCIGRDVGIGPGVTILTSQHEEAGRNVPVLHAPVRMAKVVVEDDSDLGVGSILLPGVTIGRGAIVGAGAVVTHDVEPYAVVAGNPARLLRLRP